ncbi:MAG: hypothetical protein BAJATHORv1_10143 [Candidatus Thorarchaeota archaeon]|nr:MAG: hypothetical protein BAJATHORv1_10143 [Candidatus Thorarchaeota archaeon]
MYSRRYIDISSESLKDPVVVLGLPGIANVGTIAVRALTKILDAKVVLDFFSEDFPPRIIVKNGITHFPKSSLYLYRAAPDEPHDILIVTADYQPSSGAGIFEYAEFLAQEFATLDVSSVYALAAYEVSYEAFFDSYPNPPRVFVSAGSDKMLQSLTQLDGTVPTKEGVINGANGFIPAWVSSMYDMEGACLLGETMGVIKRDYRASKTLLEKLMILLDIQLDFSIIDDDVQKVMEFIEWAKSEISERIPPKEGDESPPDRYIG